MGGVVGGGDNVGLGVVQRLCAGRCHNTPHSALRTRTGDRYAQGCNTTWTRIQQTRSAANAPWPPADTPPPGPRTAAVQHVSDLLIRVQVLLVERLQLGLIVGQAGGGACDAVLVRVAPCLRMAGKARSSSPSFKRRKEPAHRAANTADRRAPSRQQRLAPCHVLGTGAQGTQGRSAPRQRDAAAGGRIALRMAASFGSPLSYLSASSTHSRTPSACSASGGHGLFGVRLRRGRPRVSVLGGWGPAGQPAERKAGADSAACLAAGPHTPVRQALIRLGVLVHVPSLHTGRRLAPFAGWQLLQGRAVVLGKGRWRHHPPLPMPAVAGSLGRLTSR